jgi:hypothetical protein
VKLTREKFASLVLATVLGVALAGCGSTDGGTPTAKPPADPKAALAASAAGLQAGDYAFTAESPKGKSNGVVHLPSKSANLVMLLDEEGAQGSMAFRFVDAERYVKFDVDTSAMTADLDKIDTSDREAAEMVKGLRDLVDMLSGKKWQHVDVSKINEPDEFSLDERNGDLTGASELLTGVVTAQGDARTITGTLDATKPDLANSPWDTADMTAMGAAAKSLPYTATLDDQGRLTKLALDAPKSGETPAGTWTLEIKGYGTQAAQAKPAGGETEKMSAQGYEMLNS